ncbi:MAG: hypothetical protein JW715_06505 [Sedimentisphaerales bacterium]|nr:hypothetical protein [Sedimentisphaerales bacterium]
MVSGRESSKFTDELLFPKIFLAFRMAVQPTKFIIIFSALVLISLSGWLMDFTRTVTVDRSNSVTELQSYMINPAQVESFIENYKEESGDGVFFTLWHFGSEKFHIIIKELFDLNFTSVAENTADCFTAMRWALRYHTIYCIIFIAITLVVTSIAGGAICRISALQVASGEKPGLTEAMRYSLKRFTSFITAPLAPITMIIFIGIFIVLLGLIGNIPRVGELIVALGMPLALFAGFLITVVVIGTVAGFNLMFPAIAYDGSDCFDAISRSFSYVYARPWRMLLYTSIAFVYGSICYIFVRFFAFLSLLISHLFLRLSIWTQNGGQEMNKLEAIWPEPDFMRLMVTPSNLDTTNWTEKVAAFLIYIFLLAVIGLVVSFVINFYFSANTIVYSLLRHKVDNTAFEDIYIPAYATEIEPASTESTESEPPKEPETDS